MKIPPSFRGCVSVRKNGEPILRVCQGMRDLANGLSNTLDTKFPTASAGKAFVATAILRLIERGRLTLGAELGEIVSFDLRAIDPKVTVRQLLNHTSGIPDYFDESVMEDYDALWVDYPNYKIRTSADLLPLFLHKPMMYPRGVRFQYNNSGYVMLGLILEAVTGMSFDVYLRKAVFEPCGMACTGYYELDRLPANCANAYIWDAVRREYYTNIFSVDAKGTGAGGAYTTLGDVEAFWDGLLGGRLLSNGMLGEMMSIQAEAVGEDPYGYGLWLKRREGALLPYFTGCDPGVSFVSLHCPEARLEISVVSNFGDDVWAVRDALLDEYIG